MHNTPIPPDNAAQRLAQVVDLDLLLSKYWVAVRHFGSTDLVLLVDCTACPPTATATTRTELLGDPELPRFLREKFRRPPRMAPLVTAAFWVLLEEPDGHVVTLAMGAAPISPPADA